MNTVGIDQIVQQSAKEAMTNSAVMQKDDFLKMLTIQLRYQDPMNPMSNDQFASQLAQFSQLESLNNINDNIQAQIMMNQSMNNSFMINMIGKDIQSYGDLTELGENGAILGFQLYGDAQDITIKVYDENGKHIRTITEGAMRQGDRSITWDGMNDDGIKMPFGTYSFEVSATSRDGSGVYVETMNTGIVTGVSYLGGMPYLIVNGSYVNLGDIISVNLPKKETTPSD